MGRSVLLWCLACMGLAEAPTPPVWAKTDASRPAFVDSQKTDRVLVPLARFDTGKLEYDRISFGPDADGDGLQDFLVTTGWDVDGFASLAVISSKTGQPCFCRKDYVGALPSKRTFPAALAWDAGGDVDGDGVHDILIGIPERSLVALLSGKDGHLLRSFRGEAAGFGTALSLGPDLDGDGRSDLAVGSPGARLVQLFSGDSGKEMKRWAGTKELKGFGQRVRLRAVHGQEATLAVASDIQASLFNPRERAGALFSFGSVRDPAAPEAMSLAQDIDGDGFRDFLAEFSGAWNVFSFHAGKMLGAHHAVPFADVNGDGKSDWIDSETSGPLMFGTDDGAPPATSLRKRKAVMPVPSYLAEDLRQNRWDVDESGRHLLTWSDKEGSMTLSSISGRGPASPVGIPVTPPECPWLFPPDSNFPPEVEAALLPTLSLLAENLEQWSQAGPPRLDATLDKRGKAKVTAQHAAAGLALAKLADPQAGLWFWKNAGVVSTPTVRFPSSRRQDKSDHPTAMAASEAASILRAAMGKPDFAGTITRSPLVIADLLRGIDDHDPDKRLDREVLRALPLQAKVLIKGYEEDAGPWSLEIYLTVRGKRLYVAHAIYHDSSA